jgi:hypothetical protein
MEEAGDEVATDSQFKGLKEAGITRGGTLEKQPFVLKGALIASVSGLGVVGSSLSQEVNPMGPGGYLSCNPSVGVRGRANVATKEAIARDQFELNMAAAKVGLSQGKVARRGDKGAFGGLNVIAIWLAELGRASEVELELRKGAGSAIVISNPELKKGGEFRFELGA